MATNHKLEPYLIHLRALPFVRNIRLTITQKSSSPTLEIVTPSGSKRFALIVKGSHLSHAVAESILGLHQKPKQTLLLAAPYIGAPLATVLREKGACYIDLQGNCSIHIGQKYVALIEGRTAPPRPSTFKGVRAAGYQVMFAYLADPQLVSAPLREVAEVAGVSRQAVMNTRNRLAQDGSFVKAGRVYRWVEGKQENLLHHWLVGYSDVLRPSLSIGSYRTPNTDPLMLEERLREVLGEEGSFFYGGSAAGYRLTGAYRGESTVVHLEESTPAQLKDLRAIPDREGHLVLMRTFGPLSHKGATTDTVHPLLAYAEMMQGGERAREAAHEVLTKFVELS